MERNLTNFEEDDDRIERRQRRESLHDFALVASAYIFGHGLLRFFAAFLVGINDSPRAVLVERWLPLWNSIGFFVGAWGAYHFINWSGRLAASAEMRVRKSERPRPLDAPPKMETTPVPTKLIETTADGWKERMKGLQKQRNVAGILELQKSLTKSLLRERANAIDRRLGRWFTKHFQRMLMTGRAAECVEDVELVAAHYADSEEFAYFREIVPVVRQCAELKQSLQEDD